MAVLSGLIGMLIVFWEVVRHKKGGVLGFDFATGVSITFVATYSLAPFALYVSGPSGSRFFWIDLVEYNDISLAIPALLLGLFGYVSIMIAYSVTQKTRFLRQLSMIARESLLRLKPREWLRIANGFGFFSMFCLALYIERRGVGLYTLLQNAAQLRWGLNIEGVSDTSGTFLTWSMLSIPAAVLFLGMWLGDKSAWGIWQRGVKCHTIVEAPIFLTLSLIVLWIRAGRLHILNFVLVVLLFLWARYKKTPTIRFAIVLIASVFTVMITLYGKYWLAGFRGVALPETPADQFRALSLEVAFPYLSLINALSKPIAFRGFMDYLLAPLYAVGTPLYRLIAGQRVPSWLLPESVVAMNTRLILGPTAPPTIPVDVVTLGYFSAGVVGIVVSCMLLGVILGCLEMVFQGTEGVVSMVLRPMWMVFMSTIGVMYADPVNVLNDGLYVIVPTIIAMFLGAVRLFHRSYGGGGKRTVRAVECKGGSALPMP